MNKEESGAKALFLRMFNNPWLKPGIIDNEVFMDFSPMSIISYVFSENIQEPLLSEQHKMVM